MTDRPSWRCDSCGQTVTDNRGREHDEDCMTAAAEECASYALRVGAENRKLRDLLRNLDTYARLQTATSSPYLGCPLQLQVQEMLAARPPVL